MSQFALLICGASLTTQAMCLQDQRPGDVLAPLTDNSHRDCMQKLLHPDAGTDEVRSAEVFHKACGWRTCDHR